MSENDRTDSGAGSGWEPGSPALEDDPVVSEAAYLDDATVPGLLPPGGAGPQEDGLTPQFRAPEEQEADLDE